jgi:hypothetical protein
VVLFLGTSILSHRITEGLNQQFQAGKRLVIFLDSVYETEWKFLELFEEYLLGPLANKPQVFTIMSGRGRKFPWATPALRFNSEIVKLEAFNEAETVAQIKHQASIVQTSIDDLTKRLHEYSNGVPGINDWLVKDEAFLQGKAPTSLDKMLVSLLNSIDADRRSQLLDYIEAICVLQLFDDNRIEVMIQAHPKLQPNLKSEPIFQKAVRIRRELVQESLATYVDNEGAYQLDESLRRLAVEHLKQSQPDLWQKLQETALTLYEEWAQRYKRTEERWQKEIEYHRLELKNT